MPRLLNIDIDTLSNLFSSPLKGICIVNSSCLDFQFKVKIEQWNYGMLIDCSEHDIDANLEELGVDVAKGVVFKCPFCSKTIEYDDDRYAHHIVKHYLHRIGIITREPKSIDDKRCIENGFGIICITRKTKPYVVEEYSDYLLIYITNTVDGIREFLRDRIEAGITSMHTFAITLQHMLIGITCPRCGKKTIIDIRHGVAECRHCGKFTKEETMKFLNELRNAAVQKLDDAIEKVIRMWRIRSKL